MGKYYVDAAYESLNHYGEELCGDKVEIIRTDDFFLAVLADGLGSGVKANILSTLTSKIIVTMLSQGATLQEVVETISSTLPVCSERGVAYSTFTAIRITNDGDVSTVEYDNPELVYISGGVLTPIPRETIQVEGKTIHTARFKIREEDMLAVFSDGVVHAGVGRLLDLGWQYENIVNYIRDNLLGENNPRVFCRKLLTAVNALYMDKPGDDSTVCSLRVKQARPLTVMVGPPVDSSMDKAVVDKLVRSPGMKVVCGGTTSQIVSRITGRELNVSIDYENPSVPPTATMSGIDLVTEGVLTIGKSLEIIKQFTQCRPEDWDTFTLKKKDGATRLAKMMLEDCTELHFLVGRALNPAHQNPGMPVSLGLKLNLIKELCTAMESTGKQITVEYF